MVVWVRCALGSWYLIILGLLIWILFCVLGFWGVWFLVVGLTFVSCCLLMLVSVCFVWDLVGCWVVCELVFCGMVLVVLLLVLLAYRFWILCFINIDGILVLVLRLICLIIIAVVLRSGCFCLVGSCFGFVCLMLMCVCVECCFSFDYVCVWGLFWLTRLVCFC